MTPPLAPTRLAVRMGAILCMALSGVPPQHGSAQAVDPGAAAVPTALADSLAAAADMGDPEAQYAYALLYQTGAEGLATDYRSAVEWHVRAAEQDHVGAMLQLSTLLFSSDPPEALRWVVRASELGSAEAQWRAGQVLTGRIYFPGVAVDREAGVAWFERAAEQSYSGADLALADLHSDGEDTSRYAEAAELYRSAAESAGDAWAALRMGMMYAVGEGVPEDDDAARDWLSRLGPELVLDPDLFSNEDLEVLGGLQAYYGLDFTGRGGIAADPEFALEAFEIALRSPGGLIHPSFARTAQAMVGKLQN